LSNVAFPPPNVTVTCRPATGWLSKPALVTSESSIRRPMRCAPALAVMAGP
jgi:hypothetical protein